MFDASINISRPIRLAEWIQDFSELKSEDKDGDKDSKINFELLERELLVREQEVAVKQTELQLKNDLKSLLDNIDQNLNDHIQESARKLELNRANLVSLATSIANKIIGYEVQTNHDVIVNVVEKALQDLGNDNNIVIQLHSEDKKILESYMKKMALVSQNQGWQLETNDSLNRGGCKIFSNNGSIDASIESQLNNIKNFLMNNLPGKGPDSDD